LDADIWLKPVFEISHDLGEPEQIEPISMWRENGAFVNQHCTPVHHEIIKAVAQDNKVA
jgi:murein endopeptidase